RFLQPKVLNPVLILTSQTLLLVFGWVFYGITSKRPVELPESLAMAYGLSPEKFTFVVTLIASLISIASAHMSLSEPVSLFAIASGVKVAAKSPLLNLTRPLWTFGSLICVIALGAQTAGWATLLTPRDILVTAPVSGFALDMSNANFLEIAQAAFDNETFDAHRLINILPFIEASGSTAISASLGLPSILNYNEVSFINTTGGILPANLFDIPSGVTTGRFLPTNTHVQQQQSEDTPLTLPKNYTVRQQGFTASIFCEQRELDESTTPSIVFSNGTGMVDGDTIEESRMLLGCPSGNFFNSTLVYGYTPVGLSGIFYAGCRPEDNNSQNGTIVLYGIGNYDWINSTVCTVAPQVTLVDVNYVAPISLLTINNALDWPSFLDISEPVQATSPPLAGGLPIDMIWDSFETSQSISSNGIGDTLASHYLGPRDDPNFINEVLQAYLKGAFEFCGTLLRASYTESDNGLFPGGQSDIPTPMRIPVSGVFVSETVGWKQKDATVPATFVAPTFVLTMSIIIVVITLIRTRNNELIEGQDHFDARNILHVMSASSAGGLPGDFPLFSADAGKTMQYAEGVPVQLGKIEGTGRVGFVHRTSISSSPV
ncbi:hypothetical protein BDN72DRAFT_929206, partial [Pluteus cervinus]